MDKMTKCRQCGNELREIKYNVGYGLDIETLHCDKCRFNVTEPKKLKQTIRELRDRMSKKVKVVSVGEGVGIRFPKEFVENYKIKKGAFLTIEPENNEIKILV